MAILNRGAILTGRYKIERHIKSGGMGTIYLALDNRLRGARVAIKELVPADFTDSNPQTFITLFESEAATVALLRHPNIPRVTDYFAEAGNYYIVMDFIEGIDLESHLLKRGKPLPVAELISHGITVASVLEYLHGLPTPIFHKDLKPGNLLLQNDDKIVVIDFGIAKETPPHLVGKTSHTSMYGTHGYAAPEQFGGKVDARSDIYALGATLHHLASGLNPSETHEDNAFQFVPLATLRKGLPGSLVDTIHAMLSLSRDKRPGSARVVRQLLEQCQNELASRQAPYGTQVKQGVHHQRVNPALQAVARLRSAIRHQPASITNQKLAVVPQPTVLRHRFGTCSVAEAEHIMGKNFHGLESVERIFDLTAQAEHRERLNEVPFSAEYLRMRCNTHVLIAGFSLSLFDIWLKFMNSEYEPQLLEPGWPLEWQTKTVFGTARCETDARWCLIEKSVKDLRNLYPEDFALSCSEARLHFSNDEELVSAALLVQTMIVHHFKTGEALFTEFAATSGTPFGIDGFVRVQLVTAEDQLKLPGLPPLKPMIVLSTEAMDKRKPFVLPAVQINPFL